MASPSSSTSPLQPEASSSTSSPSGRTPGKHTAIRGGGTKRRSRSPASSPSSASPSSNTRGAVPSSSTSPAGSAPIGRDDGVPRSGSASGGVGNGGGVVGGGGTSTSSSSPSPSSKKQPSPSSNNHSTTPTKSSTPTRTTSTTPTDVPPSHSPSTPTGATNRSPSSTSSSSPSTPQRVSTSTLPTSTNSPSTPTGPRHSSSSSVADVDDLLELDLELSPSSSSSLQDDPSDRDRSSSSELKKVKVYELRNDSWFDRGTGHVHGLYDEGTDQALLVVTAEVTSPDPEDPEGGGGFVKEDAEEEDGGGFVSGGVEDKATIRTIRAKGVEGKILMHSHIQGKDVYQRQQDTLIVWTEPDGTDIALSFADPDDCENVWEFVLEVQKMLDSGMEEEMFTSSSPPAGYRSVSPMPSNGRNRQKTLLLHPGLGKLEAASEQVRTLARSMLGRERLVEAVIKEDYLKIMAETFENAEDLEVITDLHTLFTMMQTILLLNDTTVIEYILQEEYFMEVLGMLEYDPEFPKLKASYRSFLTSTTRFRQAVELKDSSIRSKIHQTYRLLYLKDVVLARVLEESTMNIINSMIFFNQNDIVQHVQGNDELLADVFQAFVPGGGSKGGKKAGAGGVGGGWKGKRKSTGSSWMDDDEVGTDTEDGGGKENEKPGELGADPSTSSSTLSAASSAPPSPQFSVSHKRDVVLLLHQLLLMSKNIPLPSRLQLVRTLLENGLVYVLEWAFSSRSTPPPPAPLTTTATTSAVSSEPTTTSPSSSSLPPIPATTSSLVPTPSGSPPTPSSPSSPLPDDDQIPNAAVEMLTHALDHDPSAVRTIVLAEFARMEENKEAGGTTLVVEIVKLLVGSAKKPTVAGGEDEKPSGLKSQLADALKQLLDTGEPDATFTRGPQKDGPVAEAFLTYFYENCVDDLMKPLFDLPDFKTLKGAPLNVSSTEAGLLLSLCDLLSSFSANHGHRSQYFILSGTMNLKVGCLLNAREKPLRHAAIRFFRACLKVNTHFMFRYLNKGDVFAPVLELVASESPRDNMLSSACLELFEYMRKENLKAILDHLMQHHGDRIRLLATRPVLKACFAGLITKWEQNNEPPPEPDVKVVEEETKRRFDQDEDDYFRDSDDDLAPSTSGGLSSSFLSSSYTLPSTHSSSSLAQLGPKRKRQKGQQGDSKTPSTASSSTSITTLATPSPLTSKTKNTVAPGIGLGLGLGLGLALDNYGDDDESDEDEKKPIASAVDDSSTIPSETNPNPLLTAPIPIPELTPSMDLDKPLMDWKRRREEEEEEEEKGGFASLFSSSTSGGKKSHKRSGSISSILGGSLGGGSGEEKKSRPLPATPTSGTGGEGEATNGKKEGEKEKDKKAGGGGGGGFKFSLKPFKLGGGGGGGSK